MQFSLSPYYFSWLHNHANSIVVDNATLFPLARNAGCPPQSSYPRRQISTLHNSPPRYTDRYINHSGLKVHAPSRPVRRTAQVSKYSMQAPWLPHFFLLASHIQPHRYLSLHFTIKSNSNHHTSYVHPCGFSRSSSPKHVSNLLTCFF